MSDSERARWRAAQLAGESTLTQPPPDAEQRVLAGLTSRIEAGDVPPVESATSGAATVTGSLWVKGAVVLGLAAGGGLTWHLTRTPSGPSEAPAVTASPASTAPTKSAEPVSSTPSPSPVRTAPTTPEVPVSMASAPAERPAQPASRARPKRPRRVVARPAPRSAPPAAPVTAPPPVVETAPQTDAPPPPPPEPSVFSTPAKADVTAEWRLLADARKALRAGRLAAASTALAAYRARFTNGRLDEEFWLLRIRVLLARGQTAAAQEAARSYRRRHSEGAMRALIEQLFEEK